jgi:hypothetical protein
MLVGAQNRPVTIGLDHLVSHPRIKPVRRLFVVNYHVDSIKATEPRSKRLRKDVLRLTTLGPT